MSAKIGGAIAGAALAMFVVGRADNLTAGRGWHGSSAWAQEAEDQANDAVSQDGDQAQAASDNEAAAPEATPVTASGVYSGTVMDSNQGAGTISASISQIRAKIIGTWQDTFVPPAFINGTITAKGKTTLRMRFHITGNCGYLFTGTFQHGNEISGTYKLNGCRGMAPDHGSLDMIKQ